MSYADKATPEWANEHINLLSATEEFMRRGGQSMGNLVGNPMAMDQFTHELRELRIRLLLEEVKEYLAGEGAIVDENLNLIGFRGNPDLVEIMDGLLDIQVISHGTALAYFGTRLTDNAANEVLWSNLSKVVGEGLPMLREDGKILKPPGWQPPDIKGVLDGTAGYPE